MTNNNVIIQHKDNYSILFLNRQERLNALNIEMLKSISAGFDEIEKMPAIGGVIITGVGEKAFAAGADINELSTLNELSGQSFSELGSNLFLRIERSPKLFIAAVNGFALGGGCELALACHIRFASENARFGQPEINLGIPPGFGATQRLPRLIGKGKALELILSGESIDAEEAHRIGLVNKIFTQQELVSKTCGFMENVLQKSPIARKAAIYCVNTSDNHTVDDGLRYETQWFSRLCETQDFREGTKAFIEKRKPSFKGI